MLDYRKYMIIAWNFITSLALKCTVLLVKVEKTKSFNFCNHSVCHDFRNSVHLLGEHDYLDILSSTPELCILDETQTQSFGLRQP